ILRRKSSEYARAIVGLQENFQSTTILSHSTLIPAYIIIPIVTRNGLDDFAEEEFFLTIETVCKEESIAGQELLVDIFCPLIFSRFALSCASSSEEEQ
ncbi:MAG TPA: hypothetical protein VFK06_05945, partial [Candidatus Angelobacter sp.]|nr:hypothetical protein [Candidatus Angelobacter sp.]